MHVPDRNAAMPQVSGIGDITGSEQTPARLSLGLRHLAGMTSWEALRHCSKVFATCRLHEHSICLLVLSQSSFKEAGLIQALCTC